MISFTELSEPHFSHRFEVDRVVCKLRTAYQDVLIFENAAFGKVLVLDGAVQLTEADNHIYHELLAHIPIMSAGSPAEVLIVGGGDGGILKEVLKHPVDRVVLVELDPVIIELSRKHLPSVCGGAFDDPRVEIVIGDAREFVTRRGSACDVIIVDSTDPTGPGEELFSDEFYQACRKRLRDDGVIAVQTGTPFSRSRDLGRLLARLDAQFGIARPYLAPVPTYSGLLALAAAGRALQTCPSGLPALAERFAALGIGTRYYSPEVHFGAFAMAPLAIETPRAGEAAPGWR